MKTFGSDNFSTVDRRVMKYLLEINEGHEISYADDKITNLAKEELSKLFGDFVDALFVTTGTAANVIALKLLLQYRDEAVLTSDISHVYEEETGALAASVGTQLIALGHKNGKINAQQIRDDVSMRRLLEFHSPQPRVVTIANSTETGTLYTPEEVRDISKVCHEFDMYLHMDGCRLPNVAAALDVSLKELTVDAGVDVLSFGGAKNGLMNAEAVIVFNSSLPKDRFRAYQKQSLQLSSKMRFTSGQFVPYLRDGIWLENAKHANKLAQKLKQGISESLPSIEFTRPVDTNQLFMVMPNNAKKSLRTSHTFYDWNAPGEVRLVTSWDNTEQDVQDFLEKLRHEIIK